MRGVYGFYAFGRGNQHKGFDVAAAFCLSKSIVATIEPPVASIGSMMSAGRFVHFVHQFFKIGHGLQRFFIALQADYADFCARNQV